MATLIIKMCISQEPHMRFSEFFFCQSRLIKENIFCQKKKSLNLIFFWENISQSGVMTRSCIWWLDTQHCHQVPLPILLHLARSSAFSSSSTPHFIQHGTNRKVRFLFSTQCIKYFFFFQSHFRLKSLKQKLWGLAY